jgi:hypothetical protein
MGGFEPTSSAWKAEALPLDDTRTIGSACRYRTGPSTMAPWCAASTPRPNARDREAIPSDKPRPIHSGAAKDRLSSIHRHPSVVKDPTRCELVDGHYCRYVIDAVINFTL